MAGSTGLGRAGSRPSSEKASQSIALWRLMLGRQETEGVLGKFRKTGLLPDWGQHLSIGTSRHVPGDGWPFRVSERRAWVSWEPVLRSGDSGAKRNTRHR